MRFLSVITIAALSIAWASAAGAQTREEMERCRAIEADARRLECYDAIRLSPGSPRSKYESVPLVELRNYALSYRGQLVEVTGWITPGRGFLFLGVDAEDKKPVPIDATQMPRRERSAFLQQCGEGCAAEVQGRVRPVNFTTGIVADSLVAR